MDFYQKALSEFWKRTERADQMRLSAQTPTEGLTEVVNLAYIDDENPMHLLDIYYPEDTKEPLPVLIDIHGGGWAYGTKELNKNYCLKLASMGFCVINPSYRLCPETTIIGQLQDIYQVFHWLDRNGENYPCDMNNIFITGDSAGGHLAGMAVAIMSRPDLPQIFKVKLPKIRFKAIGFTCGGFDPFKIMNWPLGLARAYKRLVLGEDYNNYPYASYLNLSALVVGADFPPIYMVSSEEDFVRSQSVAFSKKLDEYEIPYTFRLWGRVKGKTLPHVFTVTNPEWEESEITNREMLDFFRLHMSDTAKTLIV